MIKHCKVNCLTIRGHLGEVVHVGALRVEGGVDGVVGDGAGLLDRLAAVVEQGVGVGSALSRPGIITVDLFYAILIPGASCGVFSTSHVVDISANSLGMVTLHTAELRVTKVS